MCWAVRCAAFIGAPLVRNPVAAQPRVDLPAETRRHRAVLDLDADLLRGDADDRLLLRRSGARRAACPRAAPRTASSDFAGSHFTVEPMPLTGKLTCLIGTVVNSDDDGENPRIACPSSTIWSVPNPLSARTELSSGASHITELDRVQEHPGRRGLRDERGEEALLALHPAQVARPVGVPGAHVLERLAAVERVRADGHVEPGVRVLERLAPCRSRRRRARPPSS